MINSAPTQNNPLLNLESKRTIQSLTGLRLYAALAVFVSHLYHFGFARAIHQAAPSHAEVILSHLHQISYWSLAAGEFKCMVANLGHLGVSLFYTLSGFVLFLNYNQSFKLKSFYFSRLARIYPAFLLTTLLAIPMEWMSHFRNQIGVSLATNLTMTHCLTGMTCGRLNDVSWSIGVEAFFYLLFPLLLCALKRNYLLVTSLLLMLIPLILHWIDPSGFYSQHRFFLNRVPEFFVGMVAAWLYATRKHPSLNWGLFSISVIVLLSCIVPLRFLGWEAYDYLFMMPFSAFLVYFLSLKEYQGFILPALTAPLIIFGGEISYSFYLIHNLLMRYLQHILFILFHLDIARLSVPNKIGLVAVSLAASLL